MSDQPKNQPETSSQQTTLPLDEIISPVGLPDAEAALAEASPQSLSDLMNKGNYSDADITALCAIFREQRKNWRKDELAGKTRGGTKAKPKAEAKPTLSLDDLEL